jgi:pimeloyl-ACP methyl ester carboxylesterase
MKINIYIFLSLCSLFYACSPGKRVSAASKGNFKLEQVQLYDQSRQRSIPVAVYLPVGESFVLDIPLVVLSHGYGANRGGDNLAYSYLGQFLASQGIAVASIQHELPTDELLPMNGNLRETRRSNWERGAQNIRFVLAELPKRYPAFNYKKVALVGHSNGGDMSMLFAHQSPEWIQKVISLDNRRMPLPRVSTPAVYTLRSSDFSADEGVLPTLEEQKTLGITVIQLSNTRHNDMDDSGTTEQHQEINALLLKFLQYDSKY